MARHWDENRPPDDQPNMAQLFRLNEKWPYPLMPSEYVKRQFHVSFQDDPWPSPVGTSPGVDHRVGQRLPARRGTFRGSRELLARQLGDLPDDERKALVGGTLGDLLGYEAPVAV